MVIKVSREEAEARWFTDATNTDLERLWGVNKHQLWVIKTHYGLPHRPTNRTKVPTDPSPEAISQLCEEAQARWTPAERERRRVGGPRRWRPPNFTMNFQGHAAPAAVLR